MDTLLIDYWLASEAFLSLGPFPGIADLEDTEGREAGEPAFQGVLNGVRGWVFLVDWREAERADGCVHGVGAAAERLLSFFPDTLQHGRPSVLQWVWRLNIPEHLEYFLHEYVFLFSFFSFSFVCLQEITFKSPSCFYEIALHPHKEEQPYPLESSLLLQLVDHHRTETCHAGHLQPFSD